MKGVDLGYHPQRFRWFAASGALGFDGFDSGHPLPVRIWKAPFRMFGILDPSELVVISKTLTLLPRKGNLRPWRFWRAAWHLSPMSDRSMVNAVALTNPGLEYWLDNDMVRAYTRGVPIVVSVQPDTDEEAKVMAGMIARNQCFLAGMQINAGCPNIASRHGSDQEQIDATVRRFEIFRRACQDGFPIMVKFGAAQPWREIASELDGRAAAFELINAIPWEKTPRHQIGGASPLAKYGYNGSVSGGLIAQNAREALMAAKGMNLSTPIISGGGMVSRYKYDGTKVTLEEEVRERIALGADAIAFATAFLWEPWRPCKIVRKIDAELKSKKEEPIAAA